MKRFCENCGAELSEGSKFCMKCGAESKSEGVAAAPQPPEKPKKKKRSIVKTIGTVFFIIAMLSAMVHGCGGKSTTSNDTKSVSSSKVIQVKAEDMYKDYQQDEAAAEKKYKDKTVEVTGQLYSKQQFSNAQDYGLVIYQDSVGGKDYNVMVSIDKDKVSEANKVKEGDFVKVKGICVGRVQQKRENLISIQIQAKSIN